VVSARMPLGACVRGPAAWILWQTARDSLRERLRQLEVDPYVHRDIVRGFRNTIDDLELAATEYKKYTGHSSATPVAEAVEVPSGGHEAGSGRLAMDRWDTGLVAASLGCSERWVTQLCLTGRLAATKRGRCWSIDVASVEDFKRRGADAA
jgi:hypothetical protein